MDSNIKPGQFWLYKGIPYLVLKSLDKVQIMNPYCVNPNVKLNVKSENLTEHDAPAAVNVQYKDCEYFVLYNDTIISRATGNVMYWPANHGNSIAILRLARACHKHVKAIKPAAVKPPIELMPRQIWLNKRYEDVCCAIERYEIASMDVPVEWIEEYNLLKDECNVTKS